MGNVEYWLDIFILLSILLLLVYVVFLSKRKNSKKVSSDDSVAQIKETKTNTDHWGYIHLNNNRHIAYELRENSIKIHACDDISDLNGNMQIISTGFDGKVYCFHSPIPFSFEFPTFIQNTFTFQLDYAIKGYREGIKYTEAKFRFDELQFFLPSTKLVSQPLKKEILFSNYPLIVKEFDLDIYGKHCSIQFVIDTDAVYNGARAKAETYSEIRIGFEKTDDFSFLQSVYMLVDYAFAFICNRQNITCSSMKLLGEYEETVPRNGKIINKIRKTESDMIFFDEYREPPENSNVLEKTSKTQGFFAHIDTLFGIIAEDITYPGFETSKISLGSIHPSLRRRKLIDLQQSIHITAAFEFYIKKYLPAITGEKPYHNEVREALNKFINDPHSKNAKKMVKSFLDHMSDVSLKDKIMKAYNGYDGWEALKTCISEDWFTLEEVETLADEANAWRNELAHEKRTHDPSIDTVRAIRLIEHLNYAIVLREIGYSDIEIKSLLENVLIR